MDDQRNLEAQLFGDMSYEDPRKTQPAPAAGGVDPRLAGAGAVLLDDFNENAAAPPKAQPRYQELTDEQVAILQQQRAEKGQPPYTPEEIAELKAEFIERQRIAAQQQAMAEQAAAQQAAANVIFDDPADTYTAPEKREPSKILPEVDESTLFTEEEPAPERKVVFNQEDLEAAKKQAAKRASDSLKEAPAQTAEDQKRARQQMEALRQQQQADLARAGLPVAIVMTIVGVIAGGCMALFSSGKYADPDAVGGFIKLMDTVYMIDGVVLALLAATIVTRVQALKGFTSALYIISSIILVIPGAVVLFQKNGAAGFGLSVVAYLVALIGCFAVTFTISSSEKLNAYYGRKDIMYD